MNEESALAPAPRPFFVGSRERLDIGEGDGSLPNTRGVYVKTRAPKLVTVGVIATELGVPIDRVCRILRSRPHIKPRAYAGNVRLFDNAAIAQVRHELNAIDARRAGGE